jgi:anti-sigma factor RsiW
MNILDNEYDALMMDALDGAISPADRARLDTHLAQHPAEREAFERMLAVDVALRDAPPTPPSTDFSQRVMTAVRAMPIARPLRRSHIAAIIAANSALIALVWLIGGLVLVVAGMLLLQLPALQPALAFVRSVVVFFGEFFQLSSSLTRTLSRQPLFWLSAFAALVIITAWFGVMIKVLLLSGKRYATA